MEKEPQSSCPRRQNNFGMLFLWQVREKNPAFRIRNLFYADPFVELNADPDPALKFIGADLDPGSMSNKSVQHFLYVINIM